MWSSVLNVGQSAETNMPNSLSHLINDSLQRFEELIGIVPEYAQYLVDKYTKDSCCVVCGHPVKGNTVVKQLKSHLTQSQLSLIQAIKEKCLGMKIEVQVTDFQIGYDKSLSTLSNWLQEAEDLISKKKI